MAEYTAQGLGDRIMWELEKKDWTIKQLQTEVAKATDDVRSTSWPTIYSWATGKGPVYEPRREVVDAMAKVLGVLPDYLLYSGPRTAKDSPLRAPRLEDQEAINVRRRIVYESVAKEIGPLMPVGVDAGITETIMSATVSMADSMRLAGDRYGENENARHLEAAIYLGRALAGPLKALQIDATNWPETLKAQYLLQALASLKVPLDIKYARTVDAWSKARAESTKRKAKRKRAA